MSKQVALTGATGFIGRNLLTSLVKSRVPTRALTRRQQTGSELSGFVHWINGDLNNHSALNELVEGCASVIHCAGVVRGNSLEDFLEVNLRGTENLLNEICKKTYKPKFLLISSLAARYPDYSWYAQSKSLAEALLLSEKHSGLSRTVYRPTAVYGPGDKEMRPLFNAMRHGFLLAPKVADSRISLLHIDDLVNAVLKWLTAKNTGGIFELDDGTEDGYQWKDIMAIGQDTWNNSIKQVRVPIPLLNTFAHINLLLARIFRYPAMLTPGKINEITHKDWVCDNTPLTTCLGWEPKINLIDAINAASI